MYMLAIIYWWGNTKLLSLHHLSFIKDTLSAKALMLSTANMHSVFSCLGIHIYAYYDGWQHGTCLDMIEITMAVALNNNHIIYYCMDAQWWTYFDSPDYLIVQCWVHSTFFHPDTINPMGHHVYHYTMFFAGKVVCNSIGIPCTWLTAVINYANATLPFIVTTFPAL